MLVLLNVGEDIARASEIASELAARYQHSLAQVVALSAKIEMEIGQLDDEEASVFREEMGLTESSLEESHPAELSAAWIDLLFHRRP